MEELILALGSNMGDRRENLLEAVRFIKDEIGEVLKVSRIYQSRSWGYEGAHYFNIVLCCSTENTPEEVLEKTQGYERSRGRVRDKDGYSDRPIDIDIVYYSNQVIEKPGLIIPHPALHLRNFVLYPLMDICPEKVHPIFLKDTLALLGRCNDDTQVKRMADV